MSKSAELSRLIDFGDPRSSEVSLTERLTSEPDPAVALELRTLIARAVGLQGRYQEALNQLRAVRYDLPPIPSLAGVRAPLEEGRCYNDTDRPSEAFDCFSRSYRLAEEIGDEYLAMDALHMLAIVGPVASQIEWAEKALNRLDMVTDPDAAYWRGPILNNLGWTYFDMGDYDSALKIFVDSVEYRRSGPTGPLLIAEYSVARCLRQLERFDEAITRLEWLREQNDLLDRPAPFVEEEWGECLLAIGKEEEARPHFALAHEGLSKDQYIMRTEPERVDRLLRLSTE